MKTRIDVSRSVLLLEIAVLMAASFIIGIDLSLPGSTVAQGGRETVSSWAHFLMRMDK